MKINLGLFVTSLTAAAVKASTDPNAADMSAADEQTFFKEFASNNSLLNGALASIAELKAEMAAMKSETAAKDAEMAAMKSETAAKDAKFAAKDAEHDAIIASLKAHRHGVVPSNLRRRNQEMSMSMPATANIWNSGEGDEEPEENFFFEWDNHKESCCDDVKELKGRVSKIEGEVGDLNQCVDYQELYSPDGESPPLPTCKIGLGKPYVAIDGEFRVTTSTYDKEKGRVNFNTQDFDVDAQESVTVKAMKTVTVDAQDDIVLKSKNDIMAHAGNDIQIKADKDVHITADASEGSVGNVKIAGENVNVDADESVNMAAEEHVMVNAGHNVTVKAGDTVTVEADEDVKIAGQDIRVDAEASVDVSAKKHVMVNADDDVKISGDTVTVEAKDDVKIVGGDSVYVAATNASIAMTAGETVTVEAGDDVKISGQDIRVDAEASVDVSAKKHVMVNAQHNVTVMAGDTVTVEAVDDVKIVGQDVHVNAHDDIVLKSKNDIMAHAENNAVIKAEADVHITADTNGGSEGDVKISGENVHVEANDDVKIMANDDVIIDADANGNTEGNVIIEGVKYFPQKKEICWSDQTKEISLRLDPPPVYVDSADWTPVDGSGDMYSISDNEDLIGSFDFGKISVGNGPGDVVVDVVASTGGIYFAGNDYYFESNLTESLGNQSQPFGTLNSDADPKWSYVEGALVALAVELEPVGGGPKELPVPQAKVTLRSFQDVFQEYRNDDYTQGVFFQNNQTSTHPAKFLFPDIEEGEYDVKVMVFLQAESELQSAYDSDGIKIASEIKVKLGPHFISAAVIDAAHEQCGAITEEF